MFYPSARRNPRCSPVTRCVLFASLFLATAACYATAQRPDRIIFEGEEMPLFANPLEQHFAKTSKPQILSEGIRSSGNWRGYVATWLVEDDKLFLVGLKKRYRVLADAESSDTQWRELSLQTVFPQSDGRVFANWYTGDLRIPLGRQLQYIHMGYGSIYEGQLRIKVVQGLVTDTARSSRDPDEPIDTCNAVTKELLAITDGGGNDPELQSTDPARLQETEKLERECRSAK